MASTGDALELTTADFLSWLEKHSPKDVLHLGKHMQYGDEIKYVTAHFDPRKYKTLELIHITDTQYGSVCCNEQRLNEYLGWILSVDNRFVLFGGDMVDAATKLSVGHPQENKWLPNEQCFRFAKMFIPIRHRILGYVGGNHERRTDATFGTLGTLIATLLRCPFSSGQQFIDIHYGDWEPFKVSLWHGGGQARTKGAKAQLLERFMLKADSHLYLIGHLHDCLILPSWRQIRHRNRIKLEKIYGCMSSSFLDYFGGYAEVAALTATDTMMTRCILYPDRKCEVTVR